MSETHDYKEKALKLHEDYKGKIKVESKYPLTKKDDLALLYTPGVAEPCKKIAENKEDVYKYTAKGNLVAVVTDGSAVLGLGNIGPEAGMPVMEGKAILFKHFGNVDAFPILVDSQDTEKIIETVKMIAPTFGGINLEDIAAPRCFEIERRLVEELDIPVFHDDQHGTAIVVTAGVINALKVVGKKAEDVKVVINGCGAAGVAILKMMRDLGVKHILILDSKGIVYRGNERNNWIKNEVAEITNENNEKGTLEDAMKGADIFIGVSVAGAVTKEMVKSMNKDAIIFAMANPVPEIYPDEAKEAGAKVVGTGRSDFPNQINNVLCFPGLFRGALDARAKRITPEMNMAAAHAIADIVGDELDADHVIPDPMDMTIPEKVAEAVKKIANKNK
ncbi:NAD(P)-dependent malic enzyme [Ezakiella coagulans]|uniref:NAD(P)-dependent malic enzyme n=1 Tax=Ezakiella coagulans TaxID=46507 RepID=UPI002014EF06|nr:malic enzyme-like NAD(P)-binding protein [Ezakiella coagulans]UQK61657.1 NAD-dependent malic enzyme [Ezakiella coagulans]